MEIKSRIIDWLVDDSNYITSGKRNGLLITDANLHKNPLFKDITNHMRLGIHKAMIDLGHHPSFLVTSMWATKQDENGFHHLHNHRNTFLASAMYIHADAPTDGTTFVNPTAEMWQLEPAYHGAKYPYVEPSMTMPFDEGTSHVFPGWLQHYTLPSRAKTRIVIAMNTMPVGVTNRDHFDRYEFSASPVLPELEKGVF